MREPGSRFSASVGKVVAIRVDGPGNIARGNGQPLARLELHRDAVLQPAGADLRSLQIAQDANRLAFFARDLAHHFDQLELFRMGAVGKIEPGHIEPGAHQLAENRFGVTGRAQGGHNLGPAAWLRGKVSLASIRVKLIRPPSLANRRR